MRQLAQRRGKSVEALGPEAQGQGDGRGELLIERQPAVGLGQQPQPLQQCVGRFDEGRHRGHLLRSRQRRQRRPRRVAIGPHQAARAQLRAAEVARDDEGHVPQTAALQHGQHRPPGRARRFAVVVAVGDGGLTVADHVGRDVVAGVGELGPQAADERPRRLDRESGRNGGDEARIADGQLDARLGRGDKANGVHEAIVRLHPRMSCAAHDICHSLLWVALYAMMSLKPPQGRTS